VPGSGLWRWALFAVCHGGQPEAVAALLEGCTAGAPPPSDGAFEAPRDELWELLPRVCVRPRGAQVQAILLQFDRAARAGGHPLLALPTPEAALSVGRALAQACAPIAVLEAHFEHVAAVWPGSLVACLKAAVDATPQRLQLTQAICALLRLVLRLLEESFPAGSGAAAQQQGEEELVRVQELIREVILSAVACRAAGVLAAAMEAAERLGCSAELLLKPNMRVDDRPPFSLSLYVQTFLDNEGATAAPVACRPVSSQAAAVREVREVLRRVREEWEEPDTAVTTLKLSLLVGDPAAAAAAVDRGVDVGLWEEVGGAALSFLERARRDGFMLPQVLLHDDWCGVTVVTGRLCTVIDVRGCSRSVWPNTARWHGVLPADRPFCGARCLAEPLRWAGASCCSAPLPTHPWFPARPLPLPLAPGALPAP
jgi:hypothetical protein